MVLTTAVSLTGDDLTLTDVWAVAVEAARAELSDEARTRMTAARDVVERAARASSGEHTYGINTGFGRFVERTIPPELSGELQLRLLRSHACGVGDPYPDEVVRAAMMLRANALAKGYSGARPETVELLLACLNRGVLPVVPSRGSVGASGDLAPLAHLALPLIGEGWARVDGEVLSGHEALARVGLEPIRLQAKEGLSLVNGTQFMAAAGALALVRAGRLAKTADLACALSVEALQASRVSFLPEIHALRPLRGQQESAANIARLLEGSAIIEAHRWCDKVQDAYSLRCAPQVHGASRDLLAYAEATVAVELNAATDNALVSENKVLCHPASVDSIPTSAGQEDHVSMGNASALKAWQVLANAERALAIELLAGAQGIEFLAPLEPGARAAHDFVRSLSATVHEDRPLAEDIERVAAAIADGELVSAVEREVGEL